MRAKGKVAELLAQAGLELNGKNPWDPQIHNERLYDRVFKGGSLALGESYMDGWWGADDLSGFFYRLFHKGAPTRLLGIGIIAQVIKSKLFNLQRGGRAFEVGEKHYDIGNDLYQKMLGERMIYSCGYWRNARNLGEAQENKLDLICRKINIKPGDMVLDIGCGWGGFAKFAAERYGAKVIGMTVSQEQAVLARQETAGLDVEIRLSDWREIKNQTFSHVVSMGMFEHVGPKNYRAFMEKVRDLLSDDGLFLLHTIGHSKTTRNLEPWCNKYIFPNGHLPSMAQIAIATDRRWFSEALLTMEDWHNFGQDYDKTLSAWHSNFEQAWPSLKRSYSKRFYRMWNYYLLVSAGMFRARYIHLWQIVYSKHGVEGGYTPVR